MRINLLAVGTRMPQWVDAGFEFYARRFPAHLRLNLIEVRAPRRANADAGRCKSEEARRLLSALPAHTTVVALDERGVQFSSRQLADELGKWMHSGSDVSLLLGGADGLTEDCLRAARHRWSLSALTFPHGLARVMVAEQLYRAWTVVTNHPYHRA